ncbi:hypothetical protein MTR_3g052320 [Medicago truncatula]|uniref:Uncharacterized protein n=1 Tax=Medicago truncatula TaxID=3880 RepID=G7IY26_MEDTR|nr:hypothetical protein MTR_3g052320 [Medicago truncatula]
MLERASILTDVFRKLLALEFCNVLSEPQNDGFGLCAVKKSIQFRTILDHNH